MSALAVRLGGVILIVWGLTMVYGAWRPDSLAGWFFVGPFALRIRAESRLRYVVAGIGLVLTLTGAAVVVIG
ncbi:MAG TPA: hypothetical protein VND96_18095 [Candidatus Micrarchaeaceae archaeon]|nr:hypothetical protein [Candidatus Micrarchaeaceae archaeon]